MRVGIGYDVHKLVKGRKLILGGVQVSFSKGLLGHSDADVLTHAIIDAIIGAIGAGSIGEHFPDTDRQYKNISSLVLLKKTADLLDKSENCISNIDAVIICEKPKLTLFIPEMVKNIASILMISQKQVNVKAKTEEGLGFTGKGLGIAAQAVCLIHKKV